MTTRDDYINELYAPFLLEQSGQDIRRVGGARYVIENLLRLCDLASPEELLAQALVDDRIRQQLINLLTVPETWFFRDHGPFIQLAEDLRARTLRRSEHDRLSMLCWPCATGEEAYSMAAVAYACGWTAAHCHIEAHDISETHVDTARIGRYSSRALRSSVETGWLEGFIDDGEKIVIAPFLRDMVGFSASNICNAIAVCESQSYDVIFCRNVLIYLSDGQQQDVVSQLALLLKPGGKLFVGHAETGLIRHKDLVPVPRAGAFAFERRTRVGATGGVAPMTREKTRTREQTFRRKAYDGDARPTASSIVTVDELRALADAGRLDEARQRCDALLPVLHNDSEVRYVCAVVAQAQGRSKDAQTLLHGILANQPTHIAALLFLAALYERQGENEAAADLRGRAAEVRSAAGPENK